MKITKIATATAVALLVGVGSAAAYTSGDVRDTPSLAFGHGAVSQGVGANLSIPGASPRVFKPIRGQSWEPVDSHTRNPSREFN